MFNSKTLLATILVALISFVSANPTSPGDVYSSHLKLFYYAKYAAISTQDAARSVQPNSDVAVNKTDPDVAVEFAVYPGWDMGNPAGISASSVGGTELACLQACLASSTCVSYSYLPYDGGEPATAPACFLKDQLDFSVIQVEPWPVTLGIVGPCGTFNPPGPTNCFTVSITA
ncbi:hypothetical protein B0H11DRAFT_2282992 [Mycena galericulata]|nr:hypothetical protein B0H11DRAFT_2282992 [Mycena galericulata]